MSRSAGHESTDSYCLRWIIYLGNSRLTGMSVHTAPCLCHVKNCFHPHLPLNASSTWRKSSRLHDISFRIQSASYTENPDRPSSIRLRERILRQDYQERMRRVCNSISQDQVLALWGNIVALGKLRCNGADHEDWEGWYLHKECWSVLKSEKIMIKRP